MTRRIVPLGKLLRDWIYFDCPADDDKYYNIIYIIYDTFNIIVHTYKTFASIT